MEESSVRLERTPPPPPPFFSRTRELLTCTIRGHLSDHRLFFSFILHGEEWTSIEWIVTTRYPRNINSIYLLFISLHEYYYSTRIDFYRFVTVRNFRRINPLHLLPPDKSTVDVSLMKKKKKRKERTLSLYTRTHLIDLPTPVATALDNLSNPSSGFPCRKSFFLFSFLFLFRSSSFHKRREVFPWNWEIPEAGNFIIPSPPSLPRFCLLFSFDRVKNATRIKRDRRWSANDGRTRCSGKREWSRTGRLQDRPRKLFRNLVTTILSGLLPFSSAPLLLVPAWKRRDPRYLLG